MSRKAPRLCGPSRPIGRAIRRIYGLAARLGGCDIHIATERAPVTGDRIVRIEAGEARTADQIRVNTDILDDLRSKLIAEIEKEGFVRNGHGADYWSMGETTFEICPVLPYIPAPAFKITPWIKR